MGLENLTLIETDSEEEEPASTLTDEYESCDDALQPTEIDQTKFSRMATFQEVNRPPTPHVYKEEFITLAGQIKQLLRHLNKVDIEYAYEEPNIMAAMRQDFYKLAQEVRQDEENIPPELWEFLPTTEELDWVSDATKSWEEPTQTVTEDPNCAQQAQEDWDTPQHGHKRKAKVISKDNDDAYWMDPRNPTHANMTWTACVYDHCKTHYSSKEGSSWFPRKLGGVKRCKWQWFDCRSDPCPQHLWDKRERVYFPGHDDPQEIIQMQQTWRKEYDEGYA